MKLTIILYALLTYISILKLFLQIKINAFKSLSLHESHHFFLIGWNVLHIAHTHNTHTRNVEKTGIDYY